MNPHNLSLVIAAVLLFLASVAPLLGKPYLMNIGWLGLFFWVLSNLVH